ncbi:MAG: hypothetical protein GY925_08950 [Actinomycetia bacterium]|nr:hypothetical protein [Actinomycetes bacterium]
MTGDTNNRRAERRLRRRANHLRCEANNKLQPLADALRRRASELELEAAILGQQLRPIPLRTGR